MRNHPVADAKVDSPQKREKVCLSNRDKVLGISTSTQHAPDNPSHPSNYDSDYFSKEDRDEQDLTNLMLEEEPDPNEALASNPFIVKEVRKLQ